MTKEELFAQIINEAAKDTDFQTVSSDAANFFKSAISDLMKRDQRQDVRSIVSGMAACLAEIGIQGRPNGFSADDAAEAICMALELSCAQIAAYEEDE